MQEPTGTGDPMRTLTLLWRHRARNLAPGTGETRGRKPGLNVDSVVWAGVALADADGIDGLSMRKVAERLGVGTMSLYTHVPGKSELVELMVDEVLGELYADGSGLGSTWRDRLTAIANANWELYRRHPWLLHISQARPILGPHSSDKYETELSAIDGIGLSDLEMDSVVALVVGHAESAGRAWLGQVEAAQHTGIDDAQWWQEHEPVFDQLIDSSRYPVSGRVGVAAGQEYQSAHSPERALAFGLERILDGVGILIDGK